MYWDNSRIVLYFRLKEQEAMEMAARKAELEEEARLEAFLEVLSSKDKVNIS